jgi:CDP-diacylglycerol pyrophosphatase
MAFEHECHHPDCHEQVPPVMLACEEHWRMLPGSLKGRIWQAYRQGQEVTKKATPEYLFAARACDQWWREHPDGRYPPETHDPELPL